MYRVTLWGRMEMYRLYVKLAIKSVLCSIFRIKPKRTPVTLERVTEIRDQLVADGYLTEADVNGPDLLGLVNRYNATLSQQEQE